MPGSYSEQEEETQVRLPRGCSRKVQGGGPGQCEGPGHAGMGAGIEEARQGKLRRQTPGSGTAVSARSGSCIWLSLPGGNQRTRVGGRGIFVSVLETGSLHRGNCLGFLGPLGPRVNCLLFLGLSILCCQIACLSAAQTTVLHKGEAHW